MKQRHKMLTMLATAAGIAVAFAAIGLAASRIGGAVPDRVAAVSPSKNDRGYEELIRQSEPPETEAPELAVTALPAQDGEEVYYANVYGNYFHTDEYCSGMMNAMPIMADAALLLGKQPCPVCCPSGAQMEFCWATDKGQYYHYERECMGMLNAKYCTVTVARARGQKPCPVCWGE